MAAEHAYHLSISLNILKHLGINLYSNVPAVLSEVVANAWDADAENVNIDINSREGIITITDDGVAMTEKEINNKYLRVGYPKRDSDPLETPKHHRHVMGRKGIGKLALFSIAKKIEIMTVKRDDAGNVIEKNGFIMDSDKIEEKIKQENNVTEMTLVNYTPEPIPIASITITQGTRILLRDLKKEVDSTAPFLRKRLARRFSMLGLDGNFTVSIDGKPITLEDREFFSKLQYLWYLGDESANYVKLCPNLESSEKIENNLVNDNPKFKITGWIGTFNEHKDVEDGNNAITILAWDKVIHEDILKEIKVGGLFSKYLIGEIHANFVDSDADPDIATSDRQSIKEDEERFIALKTYVQQNILDLIKKRWEPLRILGATKTALKNPKIKEWFNGLGTDNKKYAQKLFAKIEMIPTADPQIKRELYKQSIVAFQTLAVKENLSALESIKTPEQFETMCEILSSMDYLEAIHYYNIVSGRLEVLDKFVELVPKERESVIRDYLFAHLWLLDPSWERATTDAHVEERVTKAFDAINAGLSEEERKGRIDIRYKSSAGEHIIIELKKYDVSVKATDLAGQVQKYKSALEKCLQTSLGYIPPIEIVCVLGGEPLPSDRKDENKRILAQVGARAITYDFLINDSRKKYMSYLEKRAEIKKFNELLDGITSDISE